MPPLSDETNAFYRDNAATYANRQRKAPAARLDRFLARLEPGARILELGCGGGQDSAYMLARGFDVTPTDGSPELAAEAERLLGRPVEVVRFDQIGWHDVFDAVWAEACLLHVPRSDLSGVLTRILRALRGGGILHASFKAGNAEGHDRFGRYYNYPSRDWLMRQFTNGWANIEIGEADGGGYDGEPTRWLHVSAAKPISAEQ
ncbi:class I SAM-dependent methyltransferase [Sinorhizobium terangae]|uniref:Methyltransferase domain-containing protein n=1 Tax=Sinorhizobium terangae TaxID=110322 RepID=A0A6N7LJX4_SINTE|nr:class I SAM-dependent methyltransferase [Sinorhizobium terangae]MBB4185650.1 SAM-dependent methyltransferase [Sinorhizobium terangae]MQX17518.1 methyltransferase domain-containing protein [Sinorhizobium terangae]WFU46292.1 class I SAM-dependent methyltransferase [Sinorhizobium terangae]